MSPEDFLNTPEGKDAKARLTKAKHDYPLSYKRINSLRKTLNGLDETLADSGFEDEVKEVQRNIERIDFLQSAMYYDISDPKMLEFCASEIKARKEIVSNTLFFYAKTVGLFWPERQAFTTELWELQQYCTDLEKIIQKYEPNGSPALHIQPNEYPEATEAITSLGMATADLPKEAIQAMFEGKEFKHLLSEEQVKYFEQLDEIEAIEAEAEQRMWNEISEEAMKRAWQEAQDKLQYLNEEAENYDKRMAQAKKHEAKIKVLVDEANRKLDTLARFRKRIQEMQGNLRQQQQEHQKELLSVSSEITALENEFAEIIPASVWPDLIMGQPSEAYDPRAAQDFQSSLEGTMDWWEQKDFLDKQVRLKELRITRSQMIREFDDSVDSLRQELNAHYKEVKTLTKEAKEAKAKLELEVGKRAAELQVAVAMPRIEGWEYLDEVEDTTVQVTGVEAEGTVGKIIEASASATINIVAKAQAEVVPAAKQTDDFLAETKNQLRTYTKEDTIAKKADAKMKAMQDALSVEISQRTKKPPPKNPQAWHTEAVEYLNKNHRLGVLVGETYKVVLNNKERHDKEMLALRCGINSNKKEYIEVEVLDRMDALGNQIMVLFPATNTIGVIAIEVIQKGKDKNRWLLKTGLSQYEKFDDFAQTCPDVPSNLKDLKGRQIHEFCAWHHKIIKHIKAHYAETKH